MRQVYNRGMIGGFKQIIKAEGAGALATGLGPTIIGYFIQGWFKFGGVEVRVRGSRRDLDRVCRSL